MKRKLLSLLVLLMTAISCAWADSYLYLDDMSLTSATLKYGDPGGNHPFYKDNNWNGDIDDFKNNGTEITVDLTCKCYDGTSLSGLFSGFGALVSINHIGNLNTSFVEDMSSMFSSCSGLESLDLSDWATSNVFTMSDMFSQCSNLTTLVLSGWDISQVRNMYAMFSGCSNLSSLDLSGWVPSSVNDMTNMFQTCYRLESLDLSGWETSQVSGMSYMFSGCKELTTLNLSGWNTSSVNNMSSMFSGCSNLETIYVGDGWSTASVTDDEYMFSSCTKLLNFENNNRVADKTYAYMGSNGYLTGTSSSVTAKEGEKYEYWATFYSDAGYYLAPEGTQVFAVNLTGTEITMTKISDGIVNKSQGVVLKSASPSITLNPSTSAGEGDYSGNSLLGTTTSITNPGNAYVLNKKSAGIGFYKLSSGGTIGANKAYLIYPDPQAGPGNTREFFGFEEATGLKAIDNGQLTIDNVVYDLQGRRVQNPTKGLYIVNGKKVVIK